LESAHVVAVDHGTCSRTLRRVRISTRTII
jgi:hypothetical protein